MAVWMLVLLALMGVLVEGSVEYLFGTAFDKWSVLTPHKWALMYLSVAVGIGVSFYYSVDFVALAVNAAGAQMATNWVGILFTGIIIGRGSNYVNDLISKWFAKPK